jgi:hypothetical protein
VLALLAVDPSGKSTLLGLAQHLCVAKSCDLVVIDPKHRLFLLSPGSPVIGGKTNNDLGRARSDPARVVESDGRSSRPASSSVHAAEG